MRVRLRVPFRVPALGRLRARPVRVRHFLYFATRPAAAHARRELFGSGVAARLSPSRQSGAWLLVAETTAAAFDALGLQRATIELARFARAHGGEYDGWDLLAGGAAAPARGSGEHAP
jgi:Regulator of ribonuclease activity B